MRAWEIEKLSSQCQIPVQLEDNNEEIWLEQGTAQEESLHAAAKIYWGSRVPGSLFRDTMAVAAIQATENRGRIVERSDELLLAGFRAITENDIVELHRATHQLFEGCRNAVIDESTDYWQYRLYDTFDQYAAAVRLPERQAVDMGAALEDRLHAGWLGQIIGGAYGTCMEGYTTDNILKAYSDLRRYIRKPNTYNDDITYELALLAAYEQHGAGTTSRDIAFEWLSRIGFGWSAEDMALRNLRCGIMPPESGRFNNPWGEWIGAQMRGTILGQLYPGDAAAAAQAAWQDAEISHFHNGILGEVFNAILCAMAFCESDTRGWCSRRPTGIPPTASTAALSASRWSSAAHMTTICPHGGSARKSWSAITGYTPTPTRPSKSSPSGSVRATSWTHWRSAASAARTLTATPRS